MIEKIWQHTFGIYFQIIQKGKQWITVTTNSVMSKAILPWMSLLGIRNEIQPTTMNRELGKQYVIIPHLKALNYNFGCSLSSNFILHHILTWR